MMHVILKPIQWIYCLYALLVFILLMIPVFLWSLVAMLFGRIEGGNLVYRACMIWGDLWFAMVFIRHKNIYESPLDTSGSYIFVCNHISYLDVPAIVKTFRHPVRPLGKAGMAKVPVFGFIYRNAIVSVDRSSRASRAESVRLLKSILMKGISVLVFPEGTFNLTGKPLKEFYDGAFRIAIETNTPIKPVLMLDTYVRMHYRHLFTLSPGINRCIFLDEISSEGYTLKEVSLLKEKVYNIMEQALIRYDAKWIGHKDAGTVI